MDGQRRRIGGRAGRGAGQAIVLLLALLVAMTALISWLLVIRGVVMERLQAQDGGDAAALAAARWQAAGLNLCGELNLIQAYMLADGEENAPQAQALHELRQRVQAVTPLLGLYSAQLVAERNGMDPQAGTRTFLEALRDSEMPMGLYEGAEEDQREMLNVILSAVEGDFCCFPLSPVVDTRSFYSYLADIEFYEAVRGRIWCWFWPDAYAFMQSYRGPQDFGQVPEVAAEPPFALRLSEETYALNELVVLSEIDAQLKDLGHPALPPPPPASANGGNGEVLSAAQRERKIPVKWTIYDADRWTEWVAMDGEHLPLGGTLKPEYDYQGTCASVGVKVGESSWIAVAKPFGDVGGQNPVPYSLVLGGFDTVRLIPVDAGDEGVQSFNVEWYIHLRAHIQDYPRTGRTYDGCKYCDALVTWNRYAFRAEGLAWLVLNHRLCRRKWGHGSIQNDAGGAYFAH